MCLVFAAIFSGLRLGAEPRVLVLNSYHAGYSWSDGELHGVQRVLLHEFPGLIPSVEFLDAKREPTLSQRDSLLAYFRSKYQGARFDLIVTLDDAALQFALAHRTDLGEQVPIVFGGVNNFRPEKVAGVGRLTGVAEGFDFVGNLDLALQLRPGLKTIHLITDSTDSGKETLAAFQEVAQQYKNRLHFVPLVDWTAEELLARLAALPPDDLALGLSNSRDAAGRVLSEDADFMRAVYERSAVPVIMITQPALPLAYGKGWEQAIWYGLGGSMISSDLHGEAVGRIACRVLRGEDADKIPVLTTSPMRLAFDYQQLVRHHIDLARLPAGAELFNRRESFFELYRWRIVTALGVIVLLAGAVVALLANNIRRQRAEGALLLLRTAVDQAKDLIALFDSDGAVHYANPALVRVLRREKEERVARCDELWRDEDGAVVSFATIGATATERGRWQQRVPVAHQDAMTSLLHVIVTPIRSEPGEPPRFLLIGQDVTQESRLEEQVRTSQKMEAIGTLASGIAHDFNNILTAIVGNTELAQMELPPGHPAAATLGEMRKATERAARLVNQILTFSRRTEPKREVLSITPVVVETLRFLRATVPASVELRHTVVSSPLIAADPTQLYQVLLNLCTNAVQAIGARPGLIELVEEEVEVGADLVASHPDLTAGPHLRLSVRDNGLGMPPEVSRRIFEPFFTTKQPGQGTGLGLSVVHGILKKHQAVITVYSVPGNGTVFRVYFPVVDAQFFAARAGKVAVAPRATGRGQRIVVVDDEEAITQIATRILVGEGYAVKVFNRSDLALAHLREAGADLLITDFSMPIMGAFGLVEQLRAFAPDMPVILISGYLSEENRAKAEAMGMAEILEKPLTMAGLVDAAARVLAGAMRN